MVGGNEILDKIVHLTTQTTRIKADATVNLSLDSQDLTARKLISIKSLFAPKTEIVNSRTQSKLFGIRVSDKSMRKYFPGPLFKSALTSVGNEFLNMVVKKLFDFTGTLP